jgi:hypothetical protein
MGVSVTGARCVLGGVEGDQSRAALYVVGGSVNSTVPNYPGLQRFALQEKSWQTIEPVTKVTQNRNHHGAAYLKGSSSILIYAGSQDGDTFPSTQTFVIGTQSPYNVRSYVSRTPPAIDPILLNWGDDGAAAIGGTSTNKKMFTFEPNSGWAEPGIEFDQPPPDPSVAPTTLLNLDDGSRILVTFDTSQSPNTVTRTVVLNPDGKPAQTGATVGDNSPPRLLRRRDVSLSDFPAYDDSLAPNTRRSGASLAQDPDGLTVIAGGNDQDPLAIFNARENNWLNATELIGGQSQSPSSPSPTSTASSTPGSDTASSTPLPISKSSADRAAMVLAAVLGSIFGLAAILILALVYLKWRKRRTKRLQLQGRLHDDFEDADSRTNSLDRYPEPIKPIARPMRSSKGTLFADKALTGGKRSHSQESNSSSSPLTGKGNKSFSPTLFSRNKQPVVISRPIPHYDHAPTTHRPNIAAPRGELHPATLRDPNLLHRKDDSGWSAYFSGSAALPPRVNRSGVASQLSTGSMGEQSRDRALPLPRSGSTDPGLTDSHGHQLERLNVRTGSPALAHADSVVENRGASMTQGVRGQISHTESMVTSVPEETDRRHTLDPGRDTESAHQSRQPTGDYSWTVRDSTWSGPSHRLTRPPSSVYPSSTHRSTAVPPLDEDDADKRPRPLTEWPTDLAAFPSTPTSKPRITQTQTPTSNVMPGTHPSEDSDHGRPGGASTDLSWLNLNAGAKGSHA